jgi:hypothetical protein
VRQAQVACTPIPEGISEIDVAQMTRLPSTHVVPPGIVECGVNLEARIVHSHQLGQYYRHYICQVVGASVSEELLEKNKNWPHAGIFELDPMFEINVMGASEEGPSRLYFIQLDRDSIQRMPDDIGPERTWIGSFEEWMEDEVTRGSLSEAEKDRLILLKQQWVADQDPVGNKEVRDELTQMLAKLCKAKNPPK